MTPIGFSLHLCLFSLLRPGATEKAPAVVNCPEGATCNGLAMVQMNSAPLRSIALIEDDHSSVAPKKTRRQQKRSGANKKRTPGAAVMLQKHYAQMPSQAEVVEDLHGSTQLPVNEDVERGIAMMQQSTAQCQTTLLEMEPELGTAMLQTNAAQAPAKVLRGVVQEDDGQSIHSHARELANSKKHVEKEASKIVGHDHKVTDIATEEYSEDTKLLGHKAQKTTFDGNDKKAKKRDNWTKADVVAAGLRAKEAGTFDADDHEAGEEEVEEEEQKQDANQEEMERGEGEEPEKTETEPTQIMTSANKILSKDMATPKRISSKEQDDAFPVDPRFKDKYNRVEKEDELVKESVAAETKTDKTDQEAASSQRSTLAKQAHEAPRKKAASPMQSAKAQAVGAKEEKTKVISQLAKSVHFDDVLVANKAA